MAKRDQSIAAMKLSEMFAAELKKAASARNLENYIPHEKQQLFHSSTTTGSLYIGGNRSGKTVGGVVEDIWRLLGKHPFKKVPPAPIRGRIVAVDFPNGVAKIILPIFKQWLPESALINGRWEDSWSAVNRTLTLANGSFVEFMSYDQETDAFAGTSRHFVHFDEEPPQHVFTECKMRLIDTAGDWYITMTPVEGMTWVYEDLYENHEIDQNLTVVEVDMEENPYLTPTAIEIAMQGLSEEEKLARKQGRFVQLSGLVFRTFDPERNLIAAPNVAEFTGSDWRIITAMDHGFRNPTAWLWNAVHTSGLVITFHEHYASEMTVDEHAAEVKRIEKELKITGLVDLRVGDPAIKQRSGLTGNSVQTQYRMHGINIVCGNNDVSGGLVKMNEYFKQGLWQISEECRYLMREIRQYRWKTWESHKIAARNNLRDEPQKKNDHAIDGERYMFSFMPDLRPVNEAAEDKTRKMISHGRQLNAKVGAIFDGMRFTLPMGPERVSATPWHHVDETVGEEF